MYGVIGKDNVDIYANASALVSGSSQEKVASEEPELDPPKVKITYVANLAASRKILSVDGTPSPKWVTKGANVRISKDKPTATTAYPDIQYKCIGWGKTPTSKTVDYVPGGKYTFYDDTTLYGIWGLSLPDLAWKTDYYWKNESEPFDRTERWINDGSISRIAIERPDPDDDDAVDSGDIVKMIGNSTLAGKGAAWTTVSDALRVDEIEFEYDIEKGDSFSSAGIMLNVTETNDPSTGNIILSGYLVSFNFTNTLLKRAGGTASKVETGAIFEFEYHTKDNKNLIDSLKLIDTFDAGLKGNTFSGKMNITAESSGYRITSNNFTGSYFINVGQANMKPNNFGFFSEHYNHDCNRIGYFELKNIKIMASL